MATDFFERQSDARASTWWLVAMFALAVVGIVGTVSTVTALMVQTQLAADHRRLAEAEPGTSPLPPQYSWGAPVAAGAVTLLLIAGGTFFKVMELRRGGGALVAERLGGRRLFPNSDDPFERRILNVVEEMAIASGTPTPPVFLMDEEAGINAFAAGYTPGDAVLGITRGCAEHLSRDELQGVVAHEFSHVLNGDMRMKIRLMGVLHGILLLGLLGHMVLRMVAYSGGGRSRGGNSKGSGQIVVVLLVISIALIVIGFIGTFFGNLIKAAVSRQREYLADASAVQFTRNPDGLANALRKIGSAAGRSRLQAANATEASHMFFARGVGQNFLGLWATHPPLEKRILAIDPRWDGKYPAASTTSTPLASDLASGFVGQQPQAAAVGGEVSLDVVDHAVDQVGEPTLEHRAFAAQLLKSVPTKLLDATRDPYGARAVTLCLVLDRHPEKRQPQLEVLTRTATPDLLQAIHGVLPTIDRIDVRARLPLVDLALPALQAMSISQYRDFARCFDAVILADQQLSFFEWVLGQVLARHLRPQFEPAKPRAAQYYALSRLAHECSLLLSAVAYAGNPAEAAPAAFEVARRRLPEVHLTLLPREASTLAALRQALDKLGQLTPKIRGRLVDACADVICADHHVGWREAEMLRGVSDLLECPMPPLLARSFDEAPA